MKETFREFMEKYLAGELYCRAYDEAVDMWGAFVMWQRLMERERAGESAQQKINIQRPSRLGGGIPWHG